MAKGRTTQRELTPDLMNRIEALPHLPGVYLMRDSDAKVIYVGKAKDLKNRVRIYFAGGDGRVQINALMRRISTFETVVTENEEQAFILERDLISKYKPRYNIKLKDDKAYLSVRIDLDQEWPRIELVRKREDDGARYFGPFSSSVELRTLLEIIRRTIPLRTCSNTVFYNRQRPCLEYQIKRCAGPCCLKVESADYKGWLKQAISILQGKTEDLADGFEAQMERAAEEMRFEDAAELRDKVDILRGYKKGQSLTAWSGEDRDVFAMYREESLVAVAVMNVRAGRLGEAETFTFTDVGISDSEILESVLSQYYEEGRAIPSEVILPELPDGWSLIQSSLKARSGRSTEFVVPQRGVKARLISLAETNARQHFVATFHADQRYNSVVGALATACKLTQIPRRIECFDISNFQGSDTVGAMVCFIDGVSDKSRYRTYKLPYLDQPDDFASIFDVVSRRLKRGKEEDDLPDLIIIDGGAAQLSKALEARELAGVNVEMVALAKMRTFGDLNSQEIARSHERLFLPGQEEPVELPFNSEVTAFVQRIRDEAHRFVITFHRKTRKKRVLSSELDKVSGLGRERKIRLLRHFRGIPQMRGVPVEELAKIGKMPRALADKLFSFLNRGSDDAS